MTYVSNNILTPEFHVLVMGWYLKSVNRLYTYFQGEAYLTLPFISIEGGEESTSEIEDNIGEITDLLGFKASYGIEYKFYDQFSLYRCWI